MRRTDRLRGLLALLALLALVVGVPWLLLSIGASPVPSSWPSGEEIWRSITSPDDGTALLVAFRYAAWLAWLFFVVSVVTELVARTTGAEVPALPGLSLPQGAARALISGAAMLFITAPAVTAWAGAAHGTTSTTSTDAASSTAASAAGGGLGLSLVSDDSTTADDGRGDDAQDRASRATERQATTDHVVQQGETLWSIAEAHLGDGARYPEIVHLNPGTISSSHWISPGTTIQLPAEATTQSSAADEASHTRTVVSGDTLWEIAEDELGEGNRYPEIVAATGTEQQPDGDRLTDPDLIRPGWQLEVPGPGQDEARPDRDAAAELLADSPTVGQVAHAETGVSATEAGATSAVSALGESAASAVGDDPADPVAAWGRTALGLGGITAAGLLALLEATRRRRARLLGRPGDRDPDPRELDLALTADGHTAATVDLALRHLVVAARQSGRGVPGLLSVRLTPQQLDVHLTSPMRLPAPWTSTADPRVWTLASDRAASLDATTLDDVPPPFPGLVTIGQDDEQAHVLVNVVETRTFVVAGQNAHTRSALAAMALDLAGSPWAASTLVTVVGGHEQLVAAIGSSRVRHVASPADYALSTRVTADPHVREVIVASGDLDEAGRQRLETAVASSPRVALVRAAARADDGAHALTISSDPDVAVLSPAYLQLQPQRLGDEELASIGELFALAAASTDRWAPPAGEPTLARVGSAAAAMGAPGIVIDADPDGLPVDDAPTRRRADLDLPVSSETTAPTLWNTPVTAPGASAPRVPGDDVPTRRRSRGLVIGDTADAATPGWLSNQITPTPGTPLPPVIAFPQHVRELTPPGDAAVLRVLGPVDIDNVDGSVDPVHRTRLTELAAFVALHPDATDAAIDDAMWPNRSRHDHAPVRTSSLAAVGEWLAGQPDAAAGREAAEEITCDWHLWRRLLPEGRVESASTSHLEQALGLVRGRPFVGAHPRHYLWAVELRATMIHDITLAAAELARRRLMEGAWSAAYDATIVGLTVEPAVEALWRMQLLAAHEMGDHTLADTAAAGLRDLSSTLGDPLEEQTLMLLRQVEHARAESAPAGQTTHHAV